MKHNFLKIVFVIALMPTFLLSACGVMQQMIQGTPTFTPTITLTPSPAYTPTSTLTPTPASTSTPTPNATATEFANRSDLMLHEIQKYVDLKYLSDSTGAYSELPDFEENFAQLNWYRWWRTDFSAKRFVITAQFTWDTSGDSIYVSGCGFTVAPKNENPQVFILHRSKVVVLNNTGYESEMLKGTGHVNIPSPTKATFTLIINGSEKTTYVLVDGKFVGKYRLQKDGTYSLGFAVFSGTSTGYGTHCKISEVKIWKIE